MQNRYLYIDIDGVLLGKADPNDHEIILSKHAKDFLSYCLQHFDCYWLTTHCRNGDPSNAINLLYGHSNASVMELLKAIKPTTWVTLKTEAIALKSDFYWIDDQLLATEYEIFKDHGVVDRWIQVNTRKYPDDLLRAMGMLRRVSG